MNISNNVLKHYLKNVYFITGTAYAGKSTAVRMLAEQYGMVCCGENYHMAVSGDVATPDTHPDLCYNKSLTDWREFVTRAPEENERWIYALGREAAEFEIAELISVAKDKKVIVDTNIPLDVLWEISDYNHVAVMLCPQSMSVERFFDRNDPEKQFLLNVIERCENPEAVMANYRKGLERINSKEHYDEYANSGFFTVVREDNGRDTRQDFCDRIARHFGLKANKVTVLPYDNAWKTAFEQIKAEITQAIGDLIVGVEHVGSTSVQGMSAKPCIDIDVVIGDYTVFDTVVSRLAEIGYRHEGDLGIKDREAFKYSDKPHLMKHHLYVCPQNSAELHRHVTFRDFLRNDPDAAGEYSRTKETAARLYPDDMDGYINCKSPCIEELYRRCGLK